MAPRTHTSPTRALLDVFHPARRRSTCANPHQFRLTNSPLPLRNVSTAAPQHSEMEVDNEERPRWAFTPPAMAAPVRSRLPRREAIWKVNDDPKKLDSFYVQFLGPGGDSILTDETKWLAVTHKSFDHGRRGFNDRLSYLGEPAFALCDWSTGSNWGVVDCRQTYRRASNESCAPGIIYSGCLQGGEGPTRARTISTSCHGRDRGSQRWC